MDIINFLNGFRKLTFAMTTLIVGVSLLLSGFLTGREFVGLISPMAVAFMGANSLEHMTKAVIVWINKKNKSNNESNS